MKNLITLSIALTLTTAVFSQATDTASVPKSKYELSMQKQVAILDTAFTPATMKTCFNSLSRIAGAEKSEWLPNYYMAYCLIMEAYQVESSQVDSYCDQANVLLDRADSLKGDKSEIFVLRAMTNSARIMVNPMSRGAKYGKQASIMLDSAQAHNVNNPRIYLTRAQGLFYTPPAFGGGKDKAKPVLEDAVKKYDSFVLINSIVPHWGKFRATQLLAECNK